ncbi:alpha/beta hydrolase [Pseudobacteriovorax antillogorgiicola]|uniref:Triacylglycerol lipase/cholesterol oxidase n=1 Tax=Pseudobacteriovorax antillogorgiicola TaxID=1513793 RepID=A0A1Y6BHC8_9BACT|nr:alpha/beta fold hydrolase [Pseudobacteriovorax antillogorgiicola]TCS55533.1 triacylglycerol lipase/cholesterol oxidase [Pseudobacteriovorax antillogorgiicola]SMF11268.1 triacylglycerol lipase/cholesterol oxidase [Pseudobacteriovorax antillogorgiicola]
MEAGQKISLEYSEEIRGFYANMESFSRGPIDQPQSYMDAADQGQSLKNKIKVMFRINISDVDDFIRKPEGQAKISGSVDSPKLGGRMMVTSGEIVLKTSNYHDRVLAGQSILEYRAQFETTDDRKYTMIGYKKFFRGPENVSWSDISTLYFDIYEGSIEGDPNIDNAKFRGTMDTDEDAFAKQMTTYRSSGPSRWLRSNAVCRFNEMMYRRYWDPYRDKLWESEPEMWEKHIIPTNTVEGVQDVDISIHPFNTKDGLGLTLTRFQRKKSKNIVLLIHGLTTSTDMFMMPEHYNFVQYLLDNGFEDVWSLDWRGSRRFPYNLQVHRYSIDHVALYDIPAAVNSIRHMVGPDVAIHAVAHCVGSIALMCSLACGRTAGLASVVSNSVSLSPSVHPMAKAKLLFAPGVMEYILRYTYISPDFPNYPPYTPGRWLSRLVSLTHPECDAAACHMISFMWGWGNPAAYQHRNLSPVTHSRLADLFGGTSMHYFRHIRKMVVEGSAVPYITHRALPRNYLDAAASVNLPPTLLVSGRDNKIFPSSNLKTHDELRQLNHKCEVEYEEFRGYGHQDIFMGRAADRDVFPKLVKFIKHHRTKP